MVEWRKDPEFVSANQAEHAFLGDYELVAFDLPADHQGSVMIGWEVYGPPDWQELLATGITDDFSQAKFEAEKIYRSLHRPN